MCRGVSFLILRDEQCLLSKVSRAFTALPDKPEGLRKPLISGHFWGLCTGCCLSHLYQRQRLYRSLYGKRSYSGKGTILRLFEKQGAVESVEKKEERFFNNPQTYTEYYVASWRSFARDHDITTRTIPIKSFFIDSSNYRCFCR